MQANPGRSESGCKFTERQIKQNSEQFSWLSSWICVAQVTPVAECVALVWTKCLILSLWHNRNPSYLYIIVYIQSILEKTF